MHYYRGKYVGSISIGHTRTCRDAEYVIYMHYQYLYGSVLIMAISHG